MKLPGKTTVYKDSVISLFPDILRLLEKEDMTVTELRQIIKADYGNYVAALNCLYALRKIEIGERGLLHFVDRD